MKLNAKNGRHLGLGLLFAAVTLGGAALAKEEAKNPAVKARIDVMQEIRKATGTLGDMAAGKMAFDAAGAASAKAALVKAAGEIPAVFKANETDPVSEALPKVWTDWSEFSEHATKLETAAKAVETSSVETLKAGMGGVGASCKSCHTEFRK